MRKLSTQTVTLSLILLVGLFWQCEDIPPTASRLVYVSADQNDMARRVTTDCAFRYNIVNTFKRLNNDGQRAAIRAGFDLWQKVNPNLGFLELPNRSVLAVKFVDPSEIPNQTATSTVGLVRGAATVTGGLRRESNGTYTILLSDTYDWSETALTKAIAYHAGLFLGMATSAESSSLMSTLFVGQSIRASKADSAAINKLYTTTCKDLTVSYMPFTLQVNGPITKTVRLDKQGIISVKATGLITVGSFVGISGPDGKDGLFGFPIPQYSIVPEFLHASLMYKLNNEANWHYCSKECSFSTPETQYADFTFGVNDLNLTDNTGAYTVVVDYK
ncbi:matrixin family metalloprotease [Spirosoma aureum]|uniref:Matrixin family metalloprotease n=1 Tax=Spirosoma aureum TaxID=2692134 RepID=A0A6G9AI91_9BACT|nr:matrixin family metalloprotease [Spirosoma aureum]QIP12039.1 matrixin family metalloprotease [Spirosoma aureum]